MAQKTAQLMVFIRLLLSLSLVVAAGCVPMDFGAPPPSSAPVPATAPAKPPAAAVVIQPVPPMPPVAPGTVEPSPPTRTAPPISTASQALLSQSRGHQAAGNYPLAAASIERALRIDPRQPLLWLELGEIRLKEGEFAQAEAVGRKALSLSTGDATLTARAEELIATAKKR